jgi:hypothetical protein
MNPARSSVEVERPAEGEASLLYDIERAHYFAAALTYAAVGHPLLLFDVHQQTGCECHLQLL